MGYALHFSELVNRLGLNYYSVRFGGILPDALTFTLFGPELGLSIVRYTLSACCCVLFYVLFVRRTHLAYGILAAIAWAFNPAAIRLLQTAYVDVAGTFLLCIGLLLLLLPKIKVSTALFAGVVLALAVSAHTHAVISLFFLLPLLVLVRKEDGIKQMFVLASMTSLSAIFIFCLASGFYYWNFGLLDWSAPTREYFQVLREGFAANWRLPWSEVFRQGSFWFIPLLAIPAYFCTNHRSALFTGSLLSILGYTGFLWYGDIFQGGFSLSMFYYFSFIVPSVTLFVTSAITEDQNTSPPSTPWYNALFTALSLLAPVFFVKSQAKEWLTGGTPWVIGFSTILLGFILLIILHRFPWRFYLLNVFLAGISWLISSTPTSSLSLGNYWKPDDLPFLTTAQKLSHALPKAKDDPEILRFWYPDSDHDSLRMVQSFYLHNPSKLQRDDYSSIPFSELSDDDIRTIRSSGVRNLVLLGTNSAQINQGISYLLHAAINFEVQQRAFLKENGEKIEFAQLYLPPPPTSIIHSLNISNFKIYSPAKAKLLPDGLHMNLTDGRWRMDATLPIPPLEPDEAIRIKFHILNGVISFGLCDEPSRNNITSLQSYAPYKTFTEAILFPKMPNTATLLFLRNLSPGTPRSKIIIQSVEIVKIIPSDLNTNKANKLRFSFFPAIQNASSSW